MNWVMSTLDHVFPGRLTNALAYGVAFLVTMGGLAGLLWSIGRLTGGN